MVGNRHTAQRIVNGENSFIDYAMEHAGLTRADAVRAMNTMRKLRVLKIDAVGGSFHVKSGNLLDVEVLRRAASM